MNRRRVLFGLAGAVALGIAVGGVAVAIPLRTVVDAVANDYVLVAAIAVVGLVVATAALVTGRASNVEQAAMPTPEEPTSVPPPGREFDAALDSWRFRLPLVGRRRRAAVRERLEATAVATVSRERNCSREVARKLVATGEWTDDPLVAAYLGTVANEAGVVSRAVGRAAALLAGETWHERCARRTAEAIAERGEWT
ncbi:DUF7269 family protein [Halomicrococcus sp. SG-WS-1]|uniref:DUF7269 family protein n=1 Tax=Halomicrococcus sp. SG-WS-1 TaxID=3439057 RepID=UPI003F78DA20